MEDTIMRKSIIIAGLAAIAAFSFSSCSKNEVDNPDLQETFTHTVTIKLDAPETRTEIVEGADEASFKWSESDAGRFVVKENETAGTDITLTSNDDYVTATLGATFKTETASEYVYSAFLAINKTNGGLPKIPATQNPTPTSYDPDADILVAKPLTFSATQDELSMQFYRPVVINKMTLKGLTAGETVSTVEISGDENIVGYYTIDSNTWSGQSNGITVNVNRNVPDGGELVIYFVSMPVEGVTLTVTATTSDNIYSKTFTKTISFVENEVTVFGVNNLTKTGKVNYSGTYVLTNGAGTKMANKWNNGNNIPAVDVSLEEGKIYYDPDAVTLSEAKITVSRITDTESEYYGLYTIVQNSKYLYTASTTASSYLKGEESPDQKAYWDIKLENDEWSIKATKSEVSRNSIRYNNNLFNCYESGQTAIALVDIDNVKPTPVITLESETINIESDAVTGGATGATFNSNTAAVTAAAYDDAECTITSEWLTVSVSEKNVSYTATANEASAERTAYIKFTATNTDGRTVSKTITVIQSIAGHSFYYEKITSVPTSWAGTYLIVCESTSKVFTGAISTTSTKYGLYDSVTISDGKITGNSTLESYECVIESNNSYTNTGYSICANNKYLYWNSGNSLNAGSSISGQNNIWGIELVDEVIRISNLNTSGTSVRYIKFNSDRFACYTHTNGYSSTAGNAIHLYKRVDSN